MKRSRELRISKLVPSADVGIPSFPIYESTVRFESFVREKKELDVQGIEPWTLYN